jgi:hypothetical protein
MKCTICYAELKPNGRSRYDRRPVYEPCQNKGKPWHTKAFAKSIPVGSSESPKGGFNPVILSEKFGVGKRV